MSYNIWPFWCFNPMDKKKIGDMLCGCTTDNGRFYRIGVWRIVEVDEESEHYICRRVRGKKELRNHLNLIAESAKFMHELYVCWHYNGGTWRNEEWAKNSK